MPDDDPPTRITRIELRPVITIRPSTSAAPTDNRLHHLSEVAHRECYIANSVRTEIVIAPTFVRQNTPSVEV